MEELLLNLDPVQAGIVTFLCVGSVKLIESLFERDWKAAAKILTSTLVGFALAFGVDGITILEGAAIGLNASGLITALSFFGKKDTEASVPVVQG